MKSFKSLGVSDILIEKLNKLGIKEPTPIQEQSLPVAFRGNDLIARAQTGTGKTLAFLLPLMLILPWDRFVVLTPLQFLARNR